MHPDRGSGALLIGGAIVMLAVAATHPTGHDIATAADLQRAVRFNAGVHGVAIGTMALLIAGTVGLHRRLGRITSSTAALSLFAFSGVAAMCAAVASGFVAPEIMARVRAGGADAGALEGLAWYTWRVNQGFARVHIGASAAAILLWSLSIVRWPRTAARGAGALGLLAGFTVLTALGSGRLTLDVHGFGAVMLAESAWLIWVGVLLMRSNEGADVTAAGARAAA